MSLAGFGFSGAFLTTGLGSAVGVSDGSGSGIGAECATEAGAGFTSIL